MTQTVCCAQPGVSLRVRPAARPVVSFDTLTWRRPLAFLKALWQDYRTRTELERLSPELRADIGLDSLPRRDTAAELEVRLTTELLRR